MRRRVVMTTKVLAVALAVGPACTKPTAEATAKATVQPDPGPSAPATASAPSASAAASPAVAVPSAYPGDGDPKLKALREELFATNKAEALAAPERFRPLCDKDGYPLVGNLARKGSDRGLQPSELCAAIGKPPKPPK